MSDTEVMADDLEKLVEPMMEMAKMVAEDETVAVFVFKANGQLGIVSHLPTSAIVPALMIFIAARLGEMADEMAPSQFVTITGPKKNVPEA